MPTFDTHASVSSGDEATANGLPPDADRLHDLPRLHVHGDQPVVELIDDEQAPAIAAEREIAGKAVLEPAGVEVDRADDGEGRHVEHDDVPFVRAAVVEALAVGRERTAHVRPVPSSRRALRACIVERGARRTARARSTSSKASLWSTAAREPSGLRARPHAYDCVRRTRPGRCHAAAVHQNGSVTVDVRPRGTARRLEQRRTRFVAGSAPGCGDYNEHQDGKGAVHDVPQDETGKDTQNVLPAGPALLEHERCRRVPRRSIARSAGRGRCPARGARRRAARSDRRSAADRPAGCPLPSSLTRILTVPAVPAVMSTATAPPAGVC